MQMHDTELFLRKLWLFSILSDESLQYIAKNSRFVSSQAGDLIFDQGDAGDCFYIIYSGRIRIIFKDNSGKEINMGVRTRGDHFGETALISHRPRNAAARAVEQSLLIAIDNEIFEKFVFSKPEIRGYFDKFIHSTSIQLFLKGCSLLSPLKPKDVQQIVKNFNPESFMAGEGIFRQGDEPDKFYLIESGKLKVIKWEDGDQSIINFLHQGEFFGEKALIEDSPRYADVVCLTNCHLFALSRDTFKELIQKSPDLKSLFSDRLHQYRSISPPNITPNIYTDTQPEHNKGELNQTRDYREKPPEVEQNTIDTSSPSTAKKKYHGLRFPFVRQHDEMGCGPACLVMISRFYGKKFSLARISELSHADNSGVTLSNLASAAEHLGFLTRGIKIKFDGLLDIKLPCVIHWQGYHYCVVYKVSKKYVWVADPAMGLRKYHREYFSDNWNGITLIIEPTPLLGNQEVDKQSSLKKFIGFVTPHKMILAEIFLASMLLNLLGLATPVFTQNIVDKVLYHENISFLNIMLIGMLIVLIFRILITIVRQYLIVHTSMKIDISMLVSFYKHLLALPLGYFKARKIGDFVSRFGENEKIRTFMTQTALTVVLDTFLIIIYLGLMLYYNANMTLLVILFIPFFIAITLGFTPFLKKLNIDAFAAGAEAKSHMIESIKAIDTVKAMHLENQIRWKWENKFIKSINIEFSLSHLKIYFHSLGDFMGTLGSTIILWYGAHEVIKHNISVGELMAFMALMGSVVTPINRIITVWDQLQETLVSVDRLNDVFAAKTEYGERDGKSPGIVMEKLSGNIRFEQVFFRYGGVDDPWILSNINIEIPAGTRCAIVGRSGSGKTTLVNLIARFFHANEGSISVGGFDIKNLNLSFLRSNVGYVLQNSFVFSGTIGDNISSDDPSATMEKIISAAKLANAHDFISNFPNGYETKVGESGLQLSGGQMQRIAIARVLYKNPGIIIFDEATSSLDIESEQAIQKNMDTILKNRTAIIIAHRLSTVRSADTIIVLDKGEVVEQGNHEELMGKKGLYYYLNHQQLNL
ncbi:putative Leukotoxin translocation ATP-binding protein LktB [Desulfamplus magnetovallimortis]|uniref:Putative Leukotoxin translocation ATP-binding protein LktB n=1 Tax=Desulfamplus magnetovallimortis TaxID=1246637 RepID=A0A1W1H9H6_9BACT|nr:peptidase domain-containing ABC transporter [Desulfamplus magnetovallimortis]SLM29137.1 putative Leukotoxin translocation ATP-binding protein LktB [Desulfamplus magnetovallimortis]